MRLGLAGGHDCVADPRGNRYVDQVITMNVADLTLARAVLCAPETVGWAEAPAYTTTASDSVFGGRC